MSESIHVVCPACQAVNRLAPERLEQNPACGRCHQTLFRAQATEVSSAALARHLERDDLPVLVDFWAPWCGPCRQFAPTFTALAARVEPGVRLLKLNTEAEPAAANQHGIRSIPTLALFLHGRELERTSGALPMPQLLAWLGQHLDRG